jgi:hypothetical protein
MDYAVYETAVQNMAKSELEDMVLGLLTELGSGCMGSVDSVRDYLALNIERHNRTRRQREAAAACEVATQAPKKARKDHLVPLCSGPKVYGCLQCGCYNNRSRLIKDACANWEEHMPHGREGVLHTDPDTYDVVTATCADCRQPVPLCGGPDTYGCPKCHIFAETPEVLLQKCRAAGCPYHGHIPMNRDDVVHHRFEKSKDGTCAACRPRTEAQIQADAQAALQAPAASAPPPAAPAAPTVPPQHMISELFTSHGNRIPIGKFHQWVRDYGTKDDDENSWYWLRKTLHRLKIRRDAKRHFYVRGAR